MVQSTNFFHVVIHELAILNAYNLVLRSHLWGNLLSCSIAQDYKARNY